MSQMFDGYALQQVQAKALLDLPYPGRTDCSVPLLYRDADGVVQYGTAWIRADKGRGVLLASRSQLRLGRTRATRTSLSEAQDAADVDLRRLDPDELVWVSRDSAVVARHPEAQWCPGSQEPAHLPHLKIIKANPSRNAWCTRKGAEYKAAAAAKRAANLSSEDVVASQ